MKKATIVLLLSTFLLNMACKGPATPIDYVQWVEQAENGLKVSTQSGNYIVTAQYKPTDYLAVKQLKKLAISEAELHTERQEFEGMEHFTLEISLANQRGDLLKEQIASAADYYERIRYFSFGIQDDLWLSYGDQIEKPCVLSHFERNFGISPSVKIVLAFEAENSNADKTLIFNDKMLGIGSVKLPFTTEALEQLPLLSLRN